jgi:hypothetical protein
MATWWPFSLLSTKQSQQVQMNHPAYSQPEVFNDDTKFPEGFLHGYATAAPQIEGAVETDGRGKSIWDPFSHQKGAVEDGSTTDVTTGSYKVSRMSQLRSSLALERRHQATGDIQM